MPSVYSRFWLYFRSDYSKLESKVKVYYGNVDEFNVSDGTYSSLKDNVILVAPEDSAVIKFAKDNVIEYIIE